jgi:N6-L-threonylcarbamoyladenine synthase
LILAIETSCDETACALVADDGRIAANVVASQADLHARYGGVVPEIASRHHLELVSPVVREALDDAAVSLDDVDRVAVTQGPGLIGALLVGLQAAKAIAWSRGLPLVPVDHLHGHVASLFLEPDPLEPPFLCLLASGGHTMLLDVQDHARWDAGSTLDDAAGEAFDRGALARPRLSGRRRVDQLAQGRSRAFSFPVARGRARHSPPASRGAAVRSARPRRRRGGAPRRPRNGSAAILSALVQRTEDAAARIGAERIAVVGVQPTRSCARPCPVPHSHRWPSAPTMER